MAKKDKNIVNDTLCTSRLYRVKVKIDNASELPEPLKRRAKFFPELIAKGLTDGVSQSKDMLLVGEFDESEEMGVDPACNVQTDMFDIMAEDRYAEMQTGAPAPVDGNS